MIFFYCKMMKSHMGLLVNRSAKLPIHTLLFFLGVRGLGGAGVDSRKTCSGSGSCMASVCTSTSLTRTVLGGLNLSHQQAESHLASLNYAAMLQRCNYARLCCGVVLAAMLCCQVVILHLCMIVSVYIFLQTAEYTSVYVLCCLTNAFRQKLYHGHQLCRIMQPMVLQQSVMF